MPTMQNRFCIYTVHVTWLAAHMPDSISMSHLLHAPSAGNRNFNFNHPEIRVRGWVIIPLHPVLGFLLQWWIPLIWWKCSWVLLPEFLFQTWWDVHATIQLNTFLFFFFFVCDTVKSFQVFPEASFKIMLMFYLLTTQTGVQLFKDVDVSVIFYATVESYYTLKW